MAEVNHNGIIRAESPEASCLKALKIHRRTAECIPRGWNPPS